MATNTSISIIIASYNTKTLLSKTLLALKEAIKKVNGPVQTIVVDNHSTDGTVEYISKEYPFVSVHVLEENKGFAYANNIGLKQSKGKYVLLLNSDVLMSDDVLTTIVNYMDEHPDVGVATCKLLFPDGAIDPACHRGFPTPWAAFTYFSGLSKIFPTIPFFSSYHLTYKDLSTIHEIDTPSGAFYFLRRGVIDDVGMLDEDYFFYAEDIDWSYRIKQKGWKIMYVPLAQAIHFKKQSGRESSDIIAKQKSTASFYDTMKIFYKKHYMEKYPKIVTGLMYCGINIVKNFALAKFKFQSSKSKPNSSF